MCSGKKGEEEEEGEEEKGTHTHTEHRQNRWKLCGVATSASMKIIVVHACVHPLVVDVFSWIT